MDRRQWFDRLAGTWDALFTEDITARLFEIIADLDLKPGTTVLDVGCGTGVLAPMLLERLGQDRSVVALDISPEMLKGAQQKGHPIQYVLADGQCLPLPDRSFDWVICNAVFPHFLDKVSALREVHRVLKDGGQLLICHPKGRETVNATHRELGAPLCSDFVPGEDEMRKLLSGANLDHAHVCDVPDRYVVRASRPACDTEEQPE